MQSGRCCCPGGSTPQQFYKRRSFEVVQFCMGELYEASVIDSCVTVYLFMVLLDIKFLSVLELLSLPDFCCFVNLSAGNKSLVDLSAQVAYRQELTHTHPRTHTHTHTHHQQQLLTSLLHPKWTAHLLCLQFK